MIYARWGKAYMPCPGFAKRVRIRNGRSCCRLREVNSKRHKELLISRKLQETGQYKMESNHE